MTQLKLTTSLIFPTSANFRFAKQIQVVPSINFRSCQLEVHKTFRTTKCQPETRKAEKVIKYLASYINVHIYKSCFPSFFHHNAVMMIKRFTSLFHPQCFAEHFDSVPAQQSYERNSYTDRGTFSSPFTRTLSFMFALFPGKIFSFSLYWNLAIAARRIFRE